MVKPAAVVFVADYAACIVAAAAVLVPTVVVAVVAVVVIASESALEVQHGAPTWPK